MTSDQWLSVEAHFNALHDLPAYSRETGLASISDEQVRLEVASLLKHTGDSDIAHVIGMIPSEGVDTNLREKRIGPWCLVRRLGLGGQGAVFEARRDDGTFDQHAALKVVKWEIDSDDARRRFNHERGILASLEHPDIARLLDGGETPDGTPYLVMEFVDGQPLTVAQSWPLRRKPEIFMRAADVVACAHRNLICSSRSCAALLASLTGPKISLGDALADAKDPSPSTHFRKAAELVDAVPSSQAVSRRLINGLLRFGTTEAQGGRMETARPSLTRALDLSLALAPQQGDLRTAAYIAMSYESVTDLDRPGHHQAAACKAWNKSRNECQNRTQSGVSGDYDRRHPGQVAAKIEGCH